MAESQGEARKMCSEFVTAEWTDQFGRQQEATVNLEEIWSSGAVLQFEIPVPVDAPIRFTGRQNHCFSGKVSKATADFIGYMVEIAFDEGVEWERTLYEPEHFFDPRSLVRNAGLKQKNERLIEEIFRALPRPLH